MSDIAVGDFTSCAVSSDGSVWCWGQLARGASGTPLRVEGIDDAVAVALGSGYGCAIRKSGKVTCWGWGLAAGGPRGQLSRGMWTVPQLTDVEELALGTTMACARDKKGRVLCWGHTTSRSQPREVRNIALPGKAKKLARGKDRFCAIVDDAMWCFRRNRLAPKRLGADLVRDVAMTRDNGVCAVTVDGRLACFGHVCMPSLRTWDHSPCDRGVHEGATVVRAGIPMCAKVDGSWQCWGDNSSGQVSHAAEAEEIQEAIALPVASGDVADLALGRTHSCARLESGGVHCWGSNYYGELGRGPSPHLMNRYIVNRKAPSADGFSLGDNHACIVADPAPVCWGTHTSAPAPMLRTGHAGNLVAEAAGATQVASMVEDACAARDGSVVCWGATYADGAMVSALPSVHALDVGKESRCAIVGDDRTLKCWGWGWNLHRPEGTPHTKTDRDPLFIAKSVETMTLGYGHVCWTERDGPLTCQGKEAFSPDLQKTAAPSTPTPLADGIGIDAISAGQRFTCVLRDQKVSCWGDDDQSQIGGDQWPKQSPIREVALPPVKAIAASARHNCAVTVAGEVWCWGDNEGGELGNGIRHVTTRPVKVAGITDAIAVKVADGGSCAILESGEVQCWGALARTLFETSAYLDRFAPAPVLDLGTRAPPGPPVRVLQPKP